MIMDGNGFIDALRRGWNRRMGEVTPRPPAVPMTLVPPISEEVTKSSFVSQKSKALGTSTAEPPALVTFLQMNPEEKFDLEAVNSIDTRLLLEQARGDKRVLREVVRTAEALLPRVRAETEDPILVSGILRTKTQDWFHRSPSARDWTAEMPLRWGGMFHESRVPGGRLSRKVSVRLTGLINQGVAASGTAAFFRAGMTGLFRGSKMMAKAVQFSLGSKRPRLTQQVAQAYLDDLAANPRHGSDHIPLERLSDVARRLGSQEVNMTLAELFPAESTNVLTVLDPRFHPGMGALVIRIVPGKNSEDATTYDLHQAEARPSRRSGSTAEATFDAVSGSPWERDTLTKKEWLVVLKALEKQKAKLESPPRENPRDRESYLSLRDLILTDASARKAFNVVHWKGRPSGMVLLCRLLSKGTLEPEVETDGDYLEAELEHVANGQADRVAKEGQWDLGHGWTILREVGKGRVRTYRAAAKSAD